MRALLKNNNSKFILIGKINGLAGESKKARRRVIKTKRLGVKYAAAYRKFIIGADIRHHLLAYAFLRGASYRSVEEKCGKDNLPKADLIYKIITAHAPYWEEYVSKHNVRGMKLYEPTLNDIQVWLAWPDKEPLTVQGGK